MAYMTPRAQARREALLAEYSAPRNRSTGMNYNPLSGIADILRGHYGREGQLSLEEEIAASDTSRTEATGALAEYLRTGNKPGLSDRDALRDENMGIIAPEEDQPVNFGNSEVQDLYLAHLLRMAEQAPEIAMAKDEQKYERGRDTQADLLAADELKYERGRDAKSDKLAASEVAYRKSRDVISDQQIAYNKQRDVEQDKIKASALVYQKMKDAREQGLVDEAKQYEFDYDESIVNAAKGKAARLNIVIDDLVTFIGSKQGRWGLPSTGFGAETASSIGGTDAKSVANILTEIKSIVGIDNLIDIKSKGGTFGALSDRELEVITAIFGSMDIGDLNLADNLEKVKTSYGNISTDMANLFKKKYPGKYAKKTKVIDGGTGMTDEQLKAALGL